MTFSSLLKVLNILLKQLFAYVKSKEHLKKKNLCDSDLEHDPWLSSPA